MIIDTHIHLDDKRYDDDLEELLQRAYDTHLIMCENQYRQKQVEIAPEDIQLVEQIQISVNTKLSKIWDDNKTANEMQMDIDEALKDTYDDVCRERNGKAGEKKSDTLEHCNPISKAKKTEAQTQN